MATRRFFYKNILETDEFLELTEEQRLLYIYLVLTSDDDGINTNVRTQLYYTGTKEADIEKLEEHNFILRDSDSKALCIIDWHYHNAVPKDRYKETDVRGFKNKLYIDDYALLTLNKTPIKYSAYKGGSMNNFIENFMKEHEYFDSESEREMDYSEPTDEYDSELTDSDSEMTEEVKERREELFEQYDEMKESGQYWFVYKMFTYVMEC